MKNSALLTDLYQLTMAFGYWKNSIADRHSVFHLFFRQTPFRGGYAVAAGLADVVDYIQSFQFTKSDLEFLASIPGSDGQPIFPADFLQFLGELKLSVNIDAIAEGTLVFPHEPLIRVSGSLLECQLLETALLNAVNFQTLIATKASRIVHIAGDESVLEFGLRRAQGSDGAVSASRAAYIGGCAATSNVLAGKLFGIPVRGTHAHSWVMAFDSEIEAFRAYAAAMPNNCVFLVDTYDTIEGVKHAIAIGQQLRLTGHRFVGIRLDSGDLCELSQQARRLLDEAGFAEAAIVASNDLDEGLMQSLKLQGAQINVWGVGTKLVTAYDQPALGGVYKLGAMTDANGLLTPKIKVSEQLIKISNPGVLQVRRYFKSNEAGVRSAPIADVITSELHPAGQQIESVDSLDPTRVQQFDEGQPYVELLQPIFRSGELVATQPSLQQIRESCRSQLASFGSNILRHANPETYPVGLESSLYEFKIRAVREARKSNRSTN
jgi:nicotinate phosphoribosyltransferase